MKSRKILDEIEQKFAELEAIKDAAREVVAFTDYKMSGVDLQTVFTPQFIEAIENLKDLLS